MNTAAALLKLVFAPLLWVKRLLTLQVRLERRGLRWRFALGAPAVPDPQPDASATEQMTVPAFEQTDQSGAPPDDMQRELGALVSQHRQTRRLMRHLAYIEQMLRGSGPDTLDALPLDVLKKGLAQLEELVVDWSSPGLAELRMRLSVLVADKEDAAPHIEPAGGHAQPSSRHASCP